MNIFVTAQSLNHNCLGSLDRHAREFAAIYDCSSGSLRLMHREILRYSLLFKLRICRSCNCFDRVEVVWIDILRNLFLSIVAHLAVGLLQPPELYNALSVEKDQGVQPIS